MINRFPTAFTHNTNQLLKCDACEGYQLLEFSQGPQST